MGFLKMSTGVYKRTEKYKKAMSTIQKLKWENPIYRKNMIEAQKRAKRKKGPWIRFNCKICGHFFWVTPSRKFKAKFCSLKCQLTHVHKGNKKKDCFLICVVCGKKKKIWPAKIKEGIVCCSRKCQWINRRGEKNPAWNGGTSREPYGLEFGPRLKEEIRKRDNYICQIAICGLVQNGRKFPIHHIDYDRKNNDKFNLITLCNHHHSRTNYDRDYWQIYLQNLQEIRLS